MTTQVVAGAVDYSASLDPATHAFVEPQAQIRSAGQLPDWLRSEGASMLVDYIQTMNEHIKGKSLSAPASVSPVVARILAVFERMAAWVDDIPPETQAQRYGNKAFRRWFARMTDLMREILPESAARAAVELEGYFAAAWGNETRIDYGTGHEMAFVAWMCCLELVHAVGPDDRVAMVLRVFNSYLAVMRKIQRVYGLEPAGSHGVWGLDDYQFMPFLWGAAQLIDHPTCVPSSVLKRDVVEAMAPEFMYMSAIAFIFKVKSGPFREHSPMLHDITAVPHWAKVNIGLQKMYVAEVLKKFPIVQHFLFGSLFRLTPSLNPNPLLVSK